MAQERKKRKKLDDDVKADADRAYTRWTKKEKDTFSRLYRILGLPIEATRHQVEKAYRRVSKSVHPDKNPHDAKATAKTAKLNDARDKIMAMFDAAEQQARLRRGSG